MSALNDRYDMAARTMRARRPISPELKDALTWQ